MLSLVLQVMVFMSDMTCSLYPEYLTSCTSLWQCSLKSSAILFTFGLFLLKNTADVVEQWFCFTILSSSCLMCSSVQKGA